VRGHLQTEFADIPAVEVGALTETKRGHLALDYTCMKWVQLSSKVRNTLPFPSCYSRASVPVCAHHVFVSLPSRRSGRLGARCLCLGRAVGMSLRLTLPRGSGSGGSAIVILGMAWCLVHVSLAGRGTSVNHIVV
jgi:hypothetical protein